MDINIRTFEEKDYASVSEIGELVFPFLENDIEVLRYRDAAWDHHYFYLCFMIEVDGQVIGFATIKEPYRAYAVGKYKLSIAIKPDFQNQGVGAYVYQHCLDLLSQREPHPTLLSAATREDITSGVNFLRKNGYELKMRMPRSELVVNGVDVSSYAQLFEQVGADGIVIKPLSELDPDVLRRCYEPYCAIWRDIPSTGEQKKPSMESFMKWTSAPQMIPEAFFMAVAGDDVVGLCVLTKFGQDATQLYNDLTGVIPSHRRKGIATALKVCAIAFAQAYGAETIITDNAEENPMYQINLKLGFQPIPAWVEYHKAV